GGESNPYVSGDGGGRGPDAAAEVLDAAGDMEAGDLPAGDARGDAFTIWPVDGWEDVALEPVQPELRVRITVPGPAPGLAVSAGSLGEGAPPPQVVLGGLVLGGPESLEVITDAGYQAAIPLGEGPYFSAPVPLSAPVRSGDSWIAAPTVVTVRAVRGGLAVSDSVQLVANPGFDLRGNLVPVPDVLFNDEPTEVRFFLDLSHAGGFDADGVYLQPMDATCTEKLPGASRKLRDDGDLETSSDEVAGDGVFTQRLYVSGVADTVLLYRAALTAQTAGGELVVFGPCMGIRVVPRIHKATCNTALLVLEKGAQGARHFREDGDDAATAARKTLVWLRTLGGVAESGAAEGGDLVWVRFTSGILGAIPLGDEAEALGVDPEFPVIGTSAAAAVVPASRQVFLEAPGGEELALAATLDGRGCPGLRVSPRGALAEDSDRLGDHGVQLWENGGGLAFGGLSDEARDAHG
ncbi:MAG: hypothetical protein FJ098_07840, partial [Deltaproteobacteria bacterium]|nr:hypothetical protein [Deltaproteobacteria bacterium]